MAEIERRHRDKPREEEREYRRRDDHRHRQRSRSPHERFVCWCALFRKAAHFKHNIFSCALYRHDGHHHRHKEGYHDDQSRGGAPRDCHMHRHHGSHDPPRRIEDSHSASHDRHSSASGERGRGGEYRTDDQRIGRDSGGREREERLHNKGASRSRDERSLADSVDARRPREGERGGGREQRGRGGGGRRQPKRERNEEEDLSNYE